MGKCHAPRQALLCSTWNNFPPPSLCRWSEICFFEPLQNGCPAGESGRKNVLRRRLVLLPSRPRILPRMAKTPAPSESAADAEINRSLTPEAKIKLYQEMVRIRRFEQVSMQHYQAGRMERPHDHRLSQPRTRPRRRDDDERMHGRTLRASHGMLEREGGLHALLRSR
jgi:hypothetical protein